MRLSEVLPEGVRVLIVADRGFGDQKLYHLLAHELKFDYAIRFRGNLYLTERKARCGQRQRGSAKEEVHAPCAGLM